jgi:hypothetical protein
MEEVPFVGGNISASVRAGDTVRRRAGPWTPAVQALLGHLQRAGFDAAPAPLGTDEKGREVLAFVPGDVHVGWPEPMPAWMYEDDAPLIAAAKLLRRYHDSVQDFLPPPDARWRVVAPGKHEVICHNDWAPYNAVFRERVPIVMLDWDMAGPGSRAWDVACSAFAWVPLSPKKLAHLTADQKAQRFARFCEAYASGIDRGEVLDTLVERLRFFADFIQAEADAGDPGFKKLADWDVPTRLRADADLLRQQRPVFAG